jgi:transcriptional regulator with XRE-family HTH domain
MDFKDSGKKLKLYRAKCGWSLEECAERAGISARYLADIERGDKVPKLETLLRLLNVLFASADDVLQDSLIVGYHPKSNEILKKLEMLDPSRRRQALEILESVIASLQEFHHSN